MKYKSLHNYSISQIGGETILVPIVNSVAKIKNVIVVNETGSFIISKLELGLTISEIVDELIKNFDNDNRQSVENETTTFVNKLCERGFFEPQN